MRGLASAWGPRGWHRDVTPGSAVETWTAEPPVRDTSPRSGAVPAQPIRVLSDPSPPRVGPDIAVPRSISSNRRGSLTVAEVGMTRLPPPWRLLLAVAAGYAAGSLTSFVLFESSSTGAVLFLPAGVTLAALVLSDRRWWPWVLAIAALVEVVI